jgi:hypothetical protein
MMEENKSGRCKEIPTGRSTSSAGALPRDERSVSVLLDSEVVEDEDPSSGEPGLVDDGSIGTTSEVAIFTTLGTKDGIGRNWFCSDAERFVSITVESSQLR